MVKRAILNVIFLLLLPAFVHAAIYVGPGNLTGSRNTTSGVIGNNDWSVALGGLEISWEIVNMGSYWSYSYEFANQNGGPIDPDIGHWLLEVSPTITEENVKLAIYDINFVMEGPRTWDADPEFPNSEKPGANKGNPNLPVDFYGIKLDSSQSVYSFNSTQDPIWGDFYAKNGGNPVATAWSSGIGTDPPNNVTDFTNWIPVPDTTVIPIPGSVWLLTSGLVGLVLVRKKISWKLIFR